jgi:hypothetical protein
MYLIQPKIKQDTHEDVHQQRNHEGRGSPPQWGRLRKQRHDGRRLHD